jgi:hypothetical protein
MTEVWASSPPAKHCRDPGTFDADEALAMSLGLSARGNRTRPLAVKAKYRTSSPRIAMYSGEYSRRLHPLRGVACSTAELRKGASPSRRIRTSDLAITDATDLFTTGEQVSSARRARTKEVAGEQAISEVPRSKRGALLAKRSPPATHRPSRSRFHGTIDRRRDSNPHCHCCEVSEIFTTSVRSLSRRPEKPRRRGSPGGTVESRWPEGLRLESK